MLVYRREGKIISDEGEYIDNSEVCYVTAERESPKSAYLIVLTTLKREYVTYAKNVESFVSAITKLDDFIKIDRGIAVNLTYKLEYDKDLGRLTYLDVKYKKENFVFVARKYEKLLKESLNKIGSDT